MKNTVTLIELSLIALFITSFAGLTLVLSKIGIDTMLYGHLQGSLDSYVLNSKPWTFGGLMALYTIAKHTTIKFI